MSLFNLGKAYEIARFRAQMAEDQEQQLEELLAQWFLDSHEGARTFLREIAMEYREAHPTRPVECAPQQVLQGLNGRGSTHDTDEMRSDMADVVERADRRPGTQAVGAGLGEAGLDTRDASAVSRDGELQSCVRVGEARESTP